ncbi:substrate-binding periplasmic protein [Kordiimonas pumila]|uniref:Substrate-binding periplasmic protein n=1 Tax=Kordiimonas pumila TaxID=2161677 RepID=A0ABV7D883_9PROT|nr:transporter substrate-binding domain-containing protein [Kordiimonas pumila]
MSKIFFSIALIGLFISVGSYRASAQNAPTIEPVSVCVEDRFWPPGSFFLNGKALGTHVEIVRNAFEQVAIPFTFIKMPWKRCLAALKTGELDAVISISYLESRNKAFYYPKGATSNTPHPQSIEQVDFVLVTKEGYPVGDIMNGAIPPQPIGVPLGYMSAERMEKTGAQVVQLMNHQDLFDLLQRGRVNSLILAKPLVDFFITQSNYEAQFKQTRLPDHSGPLYLAFSRKSKLSEEKMQAIWTAIEAVHADADLLAKLTALSYSQATVCVHNLTKCQH